MNIQNMIADIQHAIEEDTLRGYNTKLLRKALKQYKKAYDYCAQCYKSPRYVRLTGNAIERGNRYVECYRNSGKQ